MQRKSLAPRNPAQIRKQHIDKAHIRMRLAQRDDFVRL
jgi:hypothetical protein